MDACEIGTGYFGDIADVDELEKSFAANCIPADVVNMGAEEYDRFLEERCSFMAQKIKAYYLGL